MRMMLMVVRSCHALMMLHVLMYQHLELVLLVHLVLLDSPETMDLFVMVSDKFCTYCTTQIF